MQPPIFLYLSIKRWNYSIDLDDHCFFSINFLRNYLNSCVPSSHNIYRGKHYPNFEWQNLVKGRATRDANNNETCQRDEKIEKEGGGGQNKISKLGAVLELLKKHRSSITKN